MAIWDFTVYDSMESSFFFVISWRNKKMQGCFHHEPPRALRKSVTRLFDSVSGFNPSIVQYEDGYMISKRVDWDNGCGTRQKGSRIRKTVFLRFDNELNFLEESGERMGWVDTRLFRHKHRVFTSFLPTRLNLQCHSCLWHTHFVEWFPTLNVSCPSVLNSFCKGGRNHAFATPTRWLEQLEPTIVYWDGVNRWTHRLSINKTCPHRLSLTSPLVLWGGSWYLGIGHLHRLKSAYTKFGSRYTHFFFLFRSPREIVIGKEWCVASRSTNCDESVQFASGLEQSYEKDEYIVTYGARDCYSRAFRVGKREILQWM